MSLWNGNRAALSLTFDDALPCQLEYAVPALNKYDLQGTFFAISDCPEYPLDVHGWRKAVKHGHEIGSHSVSHKKAATLTFSDALYEARESKRALENHFGNTVTSFCYPYTDAPSPLQQAVYGAGYLQARGGRGARVEKFIMPHDDFNFFNMPCFHVSNACFETGDIGNWIAEALQRGAWLTLMFHAVGDGHGWDNVKADVFAEFTEHLARHKEAGLWVAPFGTVADNYRKFRR